MKRFVEDNSYLQLLHLIPSDSVSSLFGPVVADYALRFASVNTGDDSERLCTS